MSITPDRESRTINHPEPGFWLVRLNKNAPWLPARIWRPCFCTVHGEKEHDWTPDCDRFAPLLAEVDGVRIHPVTLWHWRGKSIPRTEFDNHVFAREIEETREIDQRQVMEVMGYAV